MRVGFGYDSHPFDDTRPLILGGVAIPNHPGLSGHSDGDALVHAIIDSLLGAISEGDIGQHFPPDNPEWKNVDSIDMLMQAVAIIEANNYRISNVDATIICEKPKISEYSNSMKLVLTKILRIPLDALSIKGKTNEGMGWIGLGHGLAVHAVALLTPSGDIETIDNLKTT
jgi:2-C-methyl-D-erythritol 2,4-cyclodiphosphate synthase